MRIRLFTVQFTGAGHLDCRKCNRRTTFKNGASLLVYDYPNTQVVQSAHTKVVLHECGREFFWQCDRCGEEPPFLILAKHLRGRRQMLLRCVCGGEFKQFRSPTLDLTIEPHASPATPF